MPPVDEWVHATSHENFTQIRADGHLKGNHCEDEFFDGALCRDGAPRGTWFNANNYRGGTITMTPYPEKVNHPTAKALAFPVSFLLGEAEYYHLFKISEQPRGYLQVKYAIVNERDPFFDWFAENVDPVVGNSDAYVALEWDEDQGYMWSATDAAERVLVSVFLVNHHDDSPTVSVEGVRPYDIRKIPAKQVSSPGKLKRP
ncbi:unnamed protein product [Symbiodinium sp. CCMP2592]|nr:unnamed protein product [Symbiodinium sp. CCMP2592]